MGAHAFNPSTLEAKFTEILNKKRKRKKKPGMVILPMIPTLNKAKAGVLIEGSHGYSVIHQGPGSRKTNSLVKCLPSICRALDWKDPQCL